MNYIRDKVTDPRDDWSLEPALSNQCWWVVGGLQVGVTIKNPLLFSNSQCCTLYPLLVGIIVLARHDSLLYLLLFKMRGRKGTT